MFKKGSILNKKYRIIKEIGKGQMSRTYYGERLDNENEPIIIKSVDIKGLENWKILELFEREAKILKNLNHHRIPVYIDYFMEETKDNISYFLIYKYIEGKSLNDILKSRNSLTYKEVKQVLLQVLNILKYLHNHSPVVIHRDINPNNLIMKENGNIYLVDFGAVQEKIAMNTYTKPGSTFVGTYGYIPMEQMAGKSIPESDLFSLGMTAIKLLTGEDPHKLDMKYLKPYYKGRSEFNLIDKVIDRMIEPAFEDRLNSAEEAMELLKSDELDIKVIENRKDRDYLDKPHSKSIKAMSYPDKDVLTISREVNPFIWLIPIIASALMFYFGIRYLKIFILFPIFIINLSMIPIYRSIKREKSIIIEIKSNTINIPKQLDESISIEEVFNITVNKEYKSVGVSSKTLVNLQINIETKTSGTKTIFIPNLLRKDADYIINFLTKEVERRKKLL
jgi:serine/threonine protein kinase